MDCVRTTENSGTALIVTVIFVSPALLILPKGDDVSAVNGLQLFKVDE
jgi:hypothetical protein